MWRPEDRKYKLAILAGVTALTVGIHYGWILQPLLGHIHWLHALHGRFCYIPIVIAASWFGLRGGLFQATVISILVMPYILAREHDPHELASELVEIVFYYAIAALIGALIDREFVARKKQQDAQLQVERSQQLSLVGQIAAGVAHEIKNPLASIKGSADILSDNTTTLQEKREFRDLLQKEIKRIDGTVTEFLNFARPKETCLKPMNLSETISISVRQLEAQATHQQVTLKSEIDDTIMINGDSEKIRQMTLNLLLNALQASNAGATITVCLTNSRASLAELTVADTGKGIEQENLQRVFEPFYTTKSAGTGLGLAIVKSIVEAHQGNISIRSRLSQGTIVLVQLPLCE